VSELVTVRLEDEVARVRFQHGLEAHAYLNGLNGIETRVAKDDRETRLAQSRRERTGRFGAKRWNFDPGELLFKNLSKEQLG
jgi:hypothetical protein